MLCIHSHCTGLGYTIQDNIQTEKVKHVVNISWSFAQSVVDRNSYRKSDFIREDDQLQGVFCTRDRKLYKKMKIILNVITNPK